MAAMLFGVLDVETAYADIQRIMERIHRETLSLRTESENGSITAYRIMDRYLPTLRDGRTQILDSVADVGAGNLATYVTNLYAAKSITGHDPSAEYTTMIGAMADTLDEIFNLIPKSSGKLSIESMSGTTYQVTPDSYATGAAGIVALRAQLTTLLATMEEHNP